MPKFSGVRGENGASSQDFCDLCDVNAVAGMKQINPFPLIAMLVIVGFLVLWLNGYLS